MVRQTEPAAAVGAATPEFDLDRALGTLRGRKHALICTHDNPDPDGMAAMEGMRVLFDRGGTRSTLALGGFLGRAENRSMAKVLGIPLVPMERIDPANFDLVTLIDTQPGAGNNSLPPGLHVDVVIDHHPPRGDLPSDIEWCDIRPAMGASSTIVFSYLRRCGVAIDRRLATAFLYALKTETRDLGREASAAERAAYIELMGLADHELLQRIASPKVPREHFGALVRAIGAARTVGPLVLCDLGELDYPDLVAEVADLLLRYQGAHWVLVGGHHDARGFVSLRTDAVRDHPWAGRAGSLMKRLIADAGTAGGHGMIAGAQLTARTPRGSAVTTGFEACAERLVGLLDLGGAERAALLPEG